MKLMKIKFFTVLVLVFIGLTSVGQIIIPKKDYVPKIRHSRYSFALSLMSSGNSNFISFGIMRENPDSTREVIFLKKDAFIRQACGYESSRANPDKLNYFEEYSIDIKILDELWKLKHDISPYGKELGWSTTDYGAPSQAQYSMLNEFGIHKKADYVFGENLWRFLIKVSDPTWVGQYQNQP
jgi:hypothetical protein